jgi:translation elongation factor EF-Tu-like GTPase
VINTKREQCAVLTGHQFFAVNSKIKKLHHATPDALIFYSSPSKIQTYIRKPQPATYVKHLLSGCGEALMNIHIIILAPALPLESSTSHHWLISKQNQFVIS